MTVTKSEKKSENEKHIAEKYRNFSSLANEDATKINFDNSKRQLDTML